jgi:hypothetical protein
LIYRFPQGKENFWVGFRYNTVTALLQGYTSSRNTIIVVKLVLFVMLLAPFQLKAAGNTAISRAIKRSRARLYYPRSVERFKANGYKLA